jgi:hypothetical protein
MLTLTDRMRAAHLTAASHSDVAPLMSQEVLREFLVLERGVILFHRAFTVPACCIPRQPRRRKSKVACFAQR